MARFDDFLDGPESSGRDYSDFLGTSSALGPDNKGIQAVTDLITGEGRNPQNLEEITSYGQPFQKELAIATGLMSTMNPDAQADIIRAHIPEANISKDSAGNYVVELNGQKGLINKPGLSANDLTQFTGQMLAFIPSTKLANLTNSLIAKFGLAATGAAGTSAGLDVLANEMGADVGFGEGFQNAFFSGVFGGWSEVMGALTATPRRAFMKQLAKWMGRDTTSTVTNRTLAVAKRMGLGADDITDDIAAKINAALEVTGDPESAAARVLSKRFGVSFTRGQQTGKTKFLQQEEHIRKGTLGNRAGETLRNFDDTQRGGIREAAGEISGGLGDTNSSMSVAVQGLKGAERSAWGAVDDAYSAASKGEASITGTGTSQLTKRLGQVVDEEAFILTPRLGDATRQAVKEVNALVTGASKGAQGLPRTIKEIERTRRVLSNLRASATNSTDKRQVSIILKQYDDWLDDAITNHLMSGDQEVLNQLKHARSLRRAYAQKFQQQPRMSRSGRNVPDRAGVIIEDIIEKDASPEEAIRYVFGLSNLGFKAETRTVLNRMEKVFGKGSKEWAALKEVAVLRLVEGSRSTGQLSARQIVKRIDDAINGSGQSVMKILFNKQELAELKMFASAVKRSAPELFNPSGTADTRARIMQQKMRPLFLALGISSDPVTGLAFGIANEMPSLFGGLVARRATKEVVKPVSTTLPPAIGAAAGRNLRGEIGAAYNQLTGE